jgi:hypothetical protein
MAAKAERNGQVTTAMLDTPESVPMTTRGDDLTELEMLKARIAAVQASATPDDVHCRDCFQRGRQAAIRAILDLKE